MYRQLASDATFLTQLLEIDREIAAAVQIKGCPSCTAPLDVAHFKRKPRGVPEGLTEEFQNRFSFCCRREGCRKRSTPGSVRFFQRRLWISVVFLVASILQGSAAPEVSKEWARKLDIAPRQLRRWRRWWVQEFLVSRCWRGISGFLPSAIDTSALPLSLIEHLNTKIRSELKISLLTSLRIFLIEQHF
jgi:hypothetical protein